MNKVGTGAVAIGLGSIAGFACALVLGVNENKEKDAVAKEAVQTTENLSLTDFNEIKKGVEKGTITWEHALDSLQRKSIAEKAYFEGAQMVRDSIKNVAKIAR